jgi:ABC-2 type transport system permease protein/sodium transport system permease protein
MDVAPLPVPPAGRPARAAGVGRIWRFARKELRETLRDRRTILTLLLMPVLLYPLLGIGFWLFVGSRGGVGAVRYRLGVANEAEAWVLKEKLRSGEEALAAERLPGNDRKAIAAPEPVIAWPDDGDLLRELRRGTVDVGVRLVRADRGGEEVWAFELLVKERSAHGEEALRFVQDRLNALNLHLIRVRLAEQLGRGVPLPIRTRLETVEDPESKRGGVLTALIPLILILMTITGAVYPAIDLTAGERERGTLEVLMAAPIPRLGLLLAKYVAVLAVALLTALLNLTMMTMTVLALNLGPQLFGPSGLTAGFVLGVFGLLLLFALFFSAVLLALCSFARSFKEAQAYLIPLMLASIAPGMVALLPGLKLQEDGAIMPGWLCVIPLVNVTLLGRDLVVGDAGAAAAAMVIGSTLLYAAVAISVAARLFGAEAVLFSDQKGWGDLFRRPAQRRAAPSLDGALLSLAVLFALQFMVQGFVSGADLPLGEKLAWMTATNVVLYVGLPLLMAVWGNVPAAAALQLRPGRVLAYLGAVLLGLSLWPFEAQGLMALQRLGGWSNPDLAAEAGRMVELLRPLGLPVVLATLAVVPAVVEELFFRGYLYNGLRAAGGTRVAVAASAVLFGVLHVLAGTPSWERLLTTTLLGLLLGWVRARSGSVFPGIVLHACHNGLLLVVALEPGRFGALATLADAEAPTPLGWLAGAGLLALLGAVLVAMAGRGETSGATGKVGV